MAALIAISRVSLRVHHVGDVIGGAYLGWPARSALPHSFCTDDLDVPGGGLHGRLSGCPGSGGQHGSAICARTRYEIVTSPTHASDAD